MVSRNKNSAFDSDGIDIVAVLACTSDVKVRLRRLRNLKPDAESENSSGPVATGEKFRADPAGLRLHDTRG
jgi:hypothetical protein